MTWKGMFTWSQYQLFAVDAWHHLARSCVLIIKPLSIARCLCPKHSWLTHLCKCKEGFLEGTWCMLPYIYRFSPDTFWDPFTKLWPMSCGGCQWEVSAFAVSNWVLREAMLLNDVKWSMATWGTSKSPTCKIKFHKTMDCISSCKLLCHKGQSHWEYLRHLPE